MRTAAMKQRAGVSPSDEPMILTKERQQQFLNSLKAGGRKPQTIRTYRRSLDELYDFLPDEKEITEESLKDWKDSLRKDGYAESTINIRLTAANSFLRFCGMEELMTSLEKTETYDVVSELTREEYLQFLSAVLRMKKEREYFLIKVFACVGLSVGELDCLTVESLREGTVRLPDGEERIISECLRNELLQYADHRGIREGSVFVTSAGTPMDRSNITNTIHKLAERAGLEPEKCNPRALNRMYQTTQEDIIGRLRPFYLQSYDNLLNTEQALVAWRTG